MAERRVVVTGMGLVSPLGHELEPFYDALLEGKSGVARISAFDCSEFPVQIAAQVAPLQVAGYIDAKQARRIDPFITYGVVAGKKALADASLLDKGDTLRLDRCGVLIASGMGGIGNFSKGVETLRAEGWKRISPFFVPYTLTDMCGAILAIETGFQGPNYSVANACASGSVALFLAAEHIRRGEADLFVCGGTEAAIDPVSLAGFIATKALSEQNDSPESASKPWDVRRDGFVMGEGAATLVLESEEHARARGARIYAEVLGGSINCDAYHITLPGKGGIAMQRCMAGALQNAQVTPEQVDYINAHATSTPMGDLVELQAIQRLFAGSLSSLAVNSTKSMLGHCLGAAGAFEAIVSILAIQRQRLHLTKNTEQLDAQVQVDLVLGQSIEREVRVAMSNSFGFGGHNAVLVFGKYDR